MKTKHTVKKLKDCRHSLDVTVEAEEVEAAYQTAFRSIRQKANLPGFRKGKAPIFLIEQKFEDNAREEVAKSLIDRAFRAVASEQDVTPMSMPDITEVNLERGKALTFKAEYDVAPEFKIKKYAGIKVSKPSSEVKDEDIDKTIDSFRETRSTVESLKEARPIQDGDHIDFEIEVLKDGKVIQPKKDSSMRLRSGEATGDDLLSQLKGVNAGETKEVKLAGDDQHLYRMTIKEIKQVALPEPDDAFAKNFGKESIEELREEVRKDLAKYKQQEARESMKRQVYEKLTKDNDFKVPASLIQQQAYRMTEESYRNYEMQGLSRDKLKKEDRDRIEQTAAQSAASQVRLFFILAKIAKDEQIEADEADIERRIQEVASGTGQTPDEVREKHLEDIKHELKQVKVLDHILSVASIQDETK